VRRQEAHLSGNKDSSQRAEGSSARAIAQYSTSRAQRPNRAKFDQGCYTNWTPNTKLCPSSNPFYLDCLESELFTMLDIETLVYIVDDDITVRKSLVSLIRSAGFRVQVFASADALLEARIEDGPSCLVLDLRPPELSGLDLQHRLAQAGVHIPIIFIGDLGDIRTSVRAMKGGASEFLTKPFSGQELVDAIRLTVERDRIPRQKRGEIAILQARFRSLTPRETQVMQCVVKGMLNRQIAAKLGTSVVTVKIHRAQVMHKMQARSLAELVKMAERMTRSEDQN